MHRLSPAVAPVKSFWYEGILHAWHSALLLRHVYVCACGIHLCAYCVVGAPRPAGTSSACATPPLHSSPCLLAPVRTRCWMCPLPWPSCSQVCEP